tara:strand:- start:1731 stop:1889 length:159 start_codon:yes stop_codon:yes gene_type:complete
MHDDLSLSSHERVVYYNEHMILLHQPIDDAADELGFRLYKSLLSTIQREKRQ